MTPPPGSPPWVRENPALQDLAVNPLLLTMIATAHRYRGALPGSRADLYGEICQVLLSRRVQAKDMPELVSWPAKQMLLAALAFQMMTDHDSALPAERVLEILKPQLRRFSSSVTGEVFLEDVTRNGMLVEAPAGRYAFAHLTFQEYLAARHVSANSDLVNSLAGNVSDPWWQETILLYAAAADVSVIVRACLDSGTVPALTLAFDCDEAGAEMDPELRQRLDSERQRALEPDCPPSHRRLIAGRKAGRAPHQAHADHRGRRQGLRAACPRGPVLAVSCRHPGTCRTARLTRAPTGFAAGILGHRGAGFRQVAELDHRHRDRRRGPAAAE